MKDKENQKIKIEEKEIYIKNEIDKYKKELENKNKEIKSAHQNNSKIQKEYEEQINEINKLLIDENEKFTKELENTKE